MQKIYFFAFATVILLAVSGCRSYLGSREYTEVKQGTEAIGAVEKTDYVFVQKDNQLQFHRDITYQTVYQDEIIKYTEYIFSTPPAGYTLTFIGTAPFLVPFRIATSPFVLIFWPFIDSSIQEFEGNTYTYSGTRKVLNWINIFKVTGGEINEKVKECDGVVDNAIRYNDEKHTYTLLYCHLKVILPKDEPFTMANPIDLKDLRHKCFDSALPERQMTVKISAKISDVEKSHEMRLYSIDLLSSEDKSFWDSLKTYPDEKYYSEYSNIIQWLSKLQQNNLISATAYIEISKSFQDKHDLIAKTLQERNDSRKKRMRNRSITPAGR